MKTIAENGNYGLHVDPSKNRLYLRITGCWQSIDEVPKYLDDIEAATRSLARGFTVLSDLREMTSSRNGLTDLHLRAQRTLIAAGLTKTAEIHLGNRVAKVPVNRVSAASGMSTSMFASAVEAEQWLDC